MLPALPALGSLTLPQKCRVWPKLRFGTDYAFTTLNPSIAGLRALNAMLPAGTMPFHRGCAPLRFASSGQ